MTTAALIETLEPGELVVRCADGTLLRTMTGFRTVQEQRPIGTHELMRKLMALKQVKKK